MGRSSLSLFDPIYRKRSTAATFKARYLQIVVRIPSVKQRAVSKRHRGERRPLPWRDKPLKLADGQNSIFPHVEISRHFDVFQLFDINDARPEAGFAVVKVETPQPAKLFIEAHLQNPRPLG